MFHYHIEVGFDDRMERTPDELSSLIDKYKAASMGHDKSGTTSLFFNTEENLTKRKLEGLLGAVGVIRFEKTKLKNDESTAKMIAENE